MRKALIYRNTTPQNSRQSPILSLDICDTFKTRFLGLMFRKSIPAEGGVLFINEVENIRDASIHMMFMNFNIAVFWLDHDCRVIDKTLAKKGRPFYAPQKPAKMIVETHYNNLELFSIGESLTIEIA